MEGDRAVIGGHIDPRAQGWPVPVVLGLLEAFVGVSAIGVGAFLLVDPTGASLGVSVDLIEGSPFDTYLFPGLALFLVNGVGSILGALLSFNRWRPAGTVAVALGAFLVVFVSLQVLWIGVQTPMQPITIGIGVAEMLLGVLFGRRLAGDHGLGSAE